MQQFPHWGQCRSFHRDVTSLSCHHPGVAKQLPTHCLPPSLDDTSWQAEKPWHTRPCHCPWPECCVHAPGSGSAPQPQLSGPLHSAQLTLHGTAGAKAPPWTNDFPAGSRHLPPLAGEGEAVRTGRPEDGREVTTNVFTPTEPEGVHAKTQATPSLRVGR